MGCNSYTFDVPVYNIVHVQVFTAFQYLIGELSYKVLFHFSILHKIIRDWAL